VSPWLAILGEGIVLFSCGYVGVTLLLGWREVRRGGGSLADAAAIGFGQPHRRRADPYFVYYLIPCLNEEHVIGQTVDALLGDAGATVVVIDDGSDDATAEVARAASWRRPDVVVIQRRPPRARIGKGDALNEGIATVRRLVARRGQAPERVLVCVLDADGHLSTGALRHVTPLFDDPACGGVQLAVRIRNRSRLLTRCQDFQFWSLTAVSQFGRHRVGTVSLGGNGQFTRLTALDQLGERPWGGSLTEDLDLTVSLAILGWRTATTPAAAVEQQGVERLSLLLRQRTRWYQGHLAAIRRLPEVWAAPELRTGQVLELSAYLLMPWLVDLPWSLLWIYFLYVFARGVGGADTTTVVAIAALWYVLSFWPSVLAMLVYRRRSGDITRGQALILSHASVAVSYLVLFCAWRALLRILRFDRDWAKTARSVEAGRPERVRPPSQPGVVRGGFSPLDGAPAVPGARPLLVPGRLLLGSGAHTCQPERIPEQSLVSAGERR